MTVRTRSADATRRVAGAVARLLRPGDVVALVGELGSGKTTFAQGAAAALGVVDPVTSPTFAIVAEYAGRVSVAHVDVYRLTHVQELHDLGFEEIVDDDRVTFVEWGDRVAGLLPPDRLVVRLGPGPTAEERLISVVAEGPAWADRRGPLDEVLAAVEAG